MPGSPFVYIHIYQAFFRCNEFLDIPVDSLFFMQQHQLLSGFVLPLHSVTARMQRIFDDFAFMSFYFL
jgi:hypothetical protein